MVATIEERVAAGAAWLDSTRPGWASEIILEDLDLGNSCYCVLGQIVRHEADKDGVDEADAHLLGSYGFYSLIDNINENVIEAVDRVDSLRDLYLTMVQAKKLGFHTYSEDSTAYDNGGEWRELTWQWSKLIAERTGALSDAAR